MANYHRYTNNGPMSEWGHAMFAKGNPLGRGRMMNTKATATLTNGQKIKGRLTTDHAASSYGQPVFVDEDNQAYNWAEIADIITISAQSKGGKSTSTAKATAARENGRKGGRPRKS